MVREHYKKAYLQLAVDHRITVWHVSIYMALLYKLYESGLQNPVQISRLEVMHLAHVGSIATYHKCIKQLQEYGYIKYLPSHDPSLGSRIFISN